MAYAQILEGIVSGALLLQPDSPMEYSVRGTGKIEYLRVKCVSNHGVVMLQELRIYRTILRSSWIQDGQLGTRMGSQDGAQLGVHIFHRQCAR